MLARVAMRVSRAGLPCPVPSPRDQARAVQGKATLQERALELRHEPGGWTCAPYPPALEAFSAAVFVIAITPPPPQLSHARGHPSLGFARRLLLRAPRTRRSLQPHGQTACREPCPRYARPSP